MAVNGNPAAGRAPNGRCFWEQAGAGPVPRASPRDRPYTTPACGAGNRERSLTCYSGFVDKRAQPIGSSRTESAASPSFEELAAQQGVNPVDDFETLFGEPSPEDESAEEFSVSLREWRREGARPASPR
jgi:hypothetical protein